MINLGTTRVKNGTSYELKMTQNFNTNSKGKHVNIYKSEYEEMNIMFIESWLFLLNSLFLQNSKLHMTNQDAETCWGLYSACSGFSFTSVWPGGFDNPW